MTTLRYTQDNLPTSEEFRRQLAEAMANSNPLDDLLELSAELRELESERGMTSAEFYQSFRQGEQGDDEDVTRWAMLYESYLELRKRLELALMRQAVWNTSPPVPA